MVGRHSPATHLQPRTIRIRAFEWQEIYRLPKGQARATGPQKGGDQRGPEGPPPTTQSQTISQKMREATGFYWSYGEGEAAGLHHGRSTPWW